MSLDWKLQPRLAHRSHNPMLFLAISLLLHGAVVLGLELYWRRIVNNPLQTEPDELIPIKFIEVPANKLAVKPPLNAKQKASTNSRAGGKANPELPIATGTLSVRRTTSLPSSQPRLTQSKSSTPQPSQQHTPPQQSEPAPRRDPLPLTDGDPDISTPVAAAPKQSPTPQPSQQHTPPQQSQPAPRRDLPPLTRGNSNINPPVAEAPKQSPTPKPSQPPQPRQQPQPALRRDPLQLTRGNPNISQPIAAPPKLKSSLRQPQPQNASLLGGPVTLASHDFMAYRRDNIPNANRLAPGFQGVDARQDVNIGPYLDTLRRQVEQQWHPEVSSSSEQTIIYFSVSRTGQLSDLRVFQASSSTLTDQAALKAVQQAAPFKPLPDGFQAAQLNIQFRFNINIYGELELKR